MSKKYFTVRKNPDGFGSQISALLYGYLIQESIGATYIYSQLSNIKLCYIGTQNKQIKEIQEAIDKLMNRLHVKKNNSYATTNYIRPDKYIIQDHFKSELFEDLKYAWPNKLNRNDTVTIHLRQGDDVEEDNPIRRQSKEYNSNLIRQAINKFPDHKVQVLSWREPDINPKLKELVHINTTENGWDILDHYNEMIGSDVLIIASSSFSLSAGLLNCNTVLADDNIMKISAPYPKEWGRNFRRIFND